MDVLTSDMTRLEILKDYLGKSVMSGEEDALLQKIIHAVSNQCAQFCGRDGFMSATYQHDGTVRPRLSGHGRSELHLRNTPITAITTLKRRYDESALTEGPGEEYTFDPWTGLVRLTGGNVFPEQPHTVEITYAGGYLDEDQSAALRAVYGYIERAQDLELSVLKMCAVFYHRRKRERDGIQAMSTEGGTFTFDPSAIPADVRETWMRYKHRRV